MASHFRRSRTQEPPTSIESEDASRPTGAEEGVRPRDAFGYRRVANPVGFCESEEIACPQEEQKRTESATSPSSLDSGSRAEIVTRTGASLG
jgi:hypothetical protein